MGTLAVTHVLGADELGTAAQAADEPLAEPARTGFEAPPEFPDPPDPDAGEPDDEDPDDEDPDESPEPAEAGAGLADVEEPDSPAGDPFSDEPGELDEPASPATAAAPSFAGDGAAEPFFAAARLSLR